MVIDPENEGYRGDAALKVRYNGKRVVIEPMSPDTYFPVYSAEDSSRGIDRNNGSLILAVGHPDGSTANREASRDRSKGSRSRKSGRGRKSGRKVK